MFFLSPIGVPSGVSIGHNLPQCVAWISLASKFSCVADNNETTLPK